MSNETALDVMRDKITSRVHISAALIKRMGITAEVYEGIVLNALMLVPELERCTPESMDKAVIDSITSGLVPDGKEAAIVPFKNTATLIPMIQGGLKLARRATPGLSIRVRLVYRQDHFEYSEGLRAQLDHRPDPHASQHDKDIIAAYAVATMPGAGEPEFELMFRGELDRRKAMSRRPNAGPWADHYGEMCKKTVVRQVLKRLPKAIDAPEDAPAALEDWELDAGTPPPSPPPAPAISAPSVPAASNGAAKPEPAKPKAAKPRQQPRKPEPPPVDEPPPEFESPF